MRRHIALALLSAWLLTGCGSTPPAPSPTPTPQPPAPPPAPNPEPNPAPPAPIIVPQIRYTKFLTFGDSNTEGEATPAHHDPSTPGVDRGYPFKLQAVLAARYTDQKVSVFNGGLGGERATASATLNRLRSLLDQLRPEVLILLHGVNDLNSGLPIAQVVGGVEELLGEARRRNLPAIVLTLPPQREGGEDAYAVGRIAPYNTALARMAVDEGAIVLDLHAVFPIELLAPDGLHMTAEGNQFIAQTIFDRLKSLYEIPAAAVWR